MNEKKPPIYLKVHAFFIMLVPEVLTTTESHCVWGGFLLYTIQYDITAIQVSEYGIVLFNYITISYKLLTNYLLVCSSISVN